MTRKPLISIITATFNRSNVLAHSIRSVLAQTYQHWQLWVVGDACTDDTELVVAGFADNRIHFVNLAQNIGEQSGPNNEGMRLAEGELIAFLNHDDLWYPDHLERLYNALEAGQADLVFSPTQRESPSQATRFYGRFAAGKYYPGTAVPASSWLFRAGLIDRIGPWRFYRDIYNIPSQDWLFRAWKAGCRLHGTQVPTVIAFVSGMRPGCYAERHEHEQRSWCQRMASDPFLRDGVLSEHAERKGIRRVMRVTGWMDLSVDVVRWAVMQAKSLWSHATGIDPKEVIARLKRQKPGQFIDSLRKIRGLTESGCNGAGKDAFRSTSTARK